MFGKWPMRNLVSAETEPAVNPSKIDNPKIDIFMRKTVAIVLSATRSKYETAERFAQRSGYRLSQRSRDQDSGIAAEMLQIIRKTRIDYDFSVIMRRRC